MLGTAQRLFLERGGKIKFAPSRQSLPFIEKLLNKQQIAYVDFALSEYLLRHQSDQSEELAAFICYLSMAMRAGYACIHLNQNSVIPNPTDLISENKEIEDAYEFSSLVLKGSKNIPKTLCESVSYDSPTPSTPLCRYENRIYFQRYWQAECILKQNLQRIESTTPTLCPDMANVRKKIDALKLLPEQANAILQACSNCFMVMCGGPGTGKTYTAGQLIKIFWESLTATEQQQCKMVLAAPTGKAATNLQMSVSIATAGLHHFPTISAQTLHSLLKIYSRKTNNTYLSADFILVDECSMVDLQLMTALFAAVKPGARLILLGDKNQLSPVGVGKPFSEMPSTIVLKKCLRTDLQEIVDLAESINNGNESKMLSLLTGSNVKRFPSESSMRQMQHSLVDYGVQHYLESSLNTLNRFCMLSPLREGPFGVNTLNELIFQRLLQHSRDKEWFIAPIVMTKNDYRLELSNGEIGLLYRKMPFDSVESDLNEGDYALFANKQQKIPALLLQNFEYAYCLSIHKSQGSEFDHVLLLMPEGAEHFGKEVMYTGVTRARKQLDVWGTDETLKATLKS